MAKAPIKTPGGLPLMTFAAITLGALLAWVTAQAFPIQKQINTG